jgi:phosphoribosyl 1,2-cyclic phosphodiesterase
MRIWSLGSGSKGNAFVLECGDTRLLIDAGFPPRVLAARLTALGIAPASIAACVLTHEHSDHTRGARGAWRRWRWALHATAGTMRESAGLCDVPVARVETGATLTVGRAELELVPTSHDATDPIGVVVTDRASGARAAIVYDLGCLTPAVRHAAADVDLLIVESNHDEGMLRTGPYPLYLQRRIASRTGHLSNRDASILCADVAHRGLQHVVLAHLSEQNNDHGIATATMSRALARTAFRGSVTVAPQHATAGPFCPKAGSRDRIEQLQLAF